MVNHKKVMRIMRAKGLAAKRRRRFVTTDSTHGLPVFPNLYRNLILTQPDKVWVIVVNESSETNLLFPLWRFNLARDGDLKPTSDYPKRMLGDKR